MNPNHRKSSFLSCWGFPALVAALSWLAVLCSLDPSGVYPNAPQGPGLTSDESFNVQQGVFLVEAIQGYGVALLHPDSLKEIFGHRGYLPDHPPLGRLWLGLFHHVVSALVPPEGMESPFVTACARTASATAFALLVLLVGGFSSCRYGSLAGLTSSLAVVLMPRLFGHAHLAALETFIGLAFTATVLGVAYFWARDERPPSFKIAGLTGGLFGLALLTKVQAILIPIPMTVWALYGWRKRAIVPLMVWGAVGFVVFFVGWPWLWLDPLKHLQEYFGSTTDRAELSVWYFGQKYADKQVPWHYPWVMFLSTVPIGLHVLGIWGIKGEKTPAWKEPGEQLLFGCMLFPLALFSLPGTPVYDGARLFLVVFPLWAVLIGRGAVCARDWLQKRWSRKTAVWILGGFVLFQGYGLVAFWPVHLSYYNLLVGGLRGAEQLGLETTYWGDSLTRSFLRDVADKVPEGAEVEVAPVLHQFQLPEMEAQSPILRRQGIRLKAYDEASSKRKRYVMIYWRRADLPKSLKQSLPDAKLLTGVRREGVLLAGLYQFSAPDSP